MNGFARLAAPMLAAAWLAAAPPPGAAQIAPDGPAPGAPAPTLRELLDRYREWRGGFALESLETIHERIYVETSAGQEPGAVWMERDGRTRRETATQDGREVEVAIPAGAWRATAGGAAADDPGGFERARRYSALVFGDALAGRGGARVAEAGAADVEDKTWTVVRVTFGDADTYDVFLDPVNGWLCCYRITEDGVTRLQMLGDWRLVDGVRMPFIEYTRGTGEVGVRVSAIELNRPIDPALFAKPAG